MVPIMEALPDTAGVVAMEPKNIPRLSFSHDAVINRLGIWRQKYGLSGRLDRFLPTLSSFL